MVIGHSAHPHPPCLASATSSYTYLHTHSLLVVGHRDLEDTITHHKGSALIANSDCKDHHKIGYKAFCSLARDPTYRELSLWICGYALSTT